ncbi:MAG: hypothetical protein IH840_13165 [Candidatus Heimdallarchaeota archaeon]|nr:hypothetical protein [Candidatus Heimdallarchaeota archaeon]
MFCVSTICPTNLSFVHYVIVGLYENGTPGEIFINMSKQGSTMQGILDAFAVTISLGLQNGVPLKEFIRKYLFLLT